MTLSIEPCLWIEAANARAAVERYVELIPNSSIQHCDTFENSGPNGDETVLFFEFELAGRRMQAIGASPHQQPNPSISLKFSSSDRALVEAVGRALLDGGSELMPFDSYPWSDYFGWVTDRDGISWQLMQEPVGAPSVAAVMMFVREQDGRANEAIELYSSVFPDSATESRQLYGDESPERQGKVMLAQVRLAGERFDIMDSGREHAFDFNDMVSLAVMCDGQEDVDRYWAALLAGGGEPVQCGWLKDRFGVSWQIVPRRLNELLRDPDPRRSAAVMHRMLEQIKLDVAELEAAYFA